MNPKLMIRSRSIGTTQLGSLDPAHGPDAHPVNRDPAPGAASTVTLVVATGT